MQKEHRSNSKLAGHHRKPLNRLTLGRCTEWAALRLSEKAPNIDYFSWFHFANARLFVSIDMRLTEIANKQMCYPNDAV